MTDENSDDDRSRDANPPDEDPFSKLEDDVRDRKGDPFSQLGDSPDGASRDPAGADQGPTDEPGDSFDQGPSDQGSSDQRSSDQGPSDQGSSDQGSSDQGPFGQGSSDGGPSDQDPFTYADETGAAPTSDTSRGGDEFPAADDQRGDPFESGNSAFERVQVDEVDPDSVWEDLTSSGAEESVESGTAGTETAESGVAGTETADTGTAGDSSVSLGEGGGRSAAIPDPDEPVEVSKHSYCEGCEYFSPPPNVSCGHEGTDILEFVDMDQVRVVNCPIVAEQRQLGGER